MTQDYPEVRKFINLVQKALDLFENIDVKIKSDNEITSYLYTDKTTGETSETVIAVTKSQKGNTTTVSNNIISKTTYIPCYIKANKQLAIAMHYGIKTFGKPKSQDGVSCVNEERKMMKDFMCGNMDCSQYTNIPPTISSEFLVLAAIRTFVIKQILWIPQLMKIVEHGKEIDVWGEFSTSYNYLLLNP